MTDDPDGVAGDSDTVAGTPDSLLADPTPWEGTSADPNDEQFGDVVATASPSEADAYDVVVVGEPYDGAVIGRRGAREGPAAIREELAGLKTHHFGAGPVACDQETTSTASTVSPTSTIADLGDVAIGSSLGDIATGASRSDAATGPNRGDDATDSPFESAPTTTAAVQDRVATLARELHASDATPVFLGGDNSLTVGNVRPLVEAAHEAGERVGVVNLDAHLDVREPTDGPTSGTPYRQLLEAGLDRYVVVGARHFETSTAYATFVEEQGGSVVTADEVARDVDAARTHIASATADLDRVYVSVDLDVLDAAAAPGVSAPTPGGLANRELFALVRSLASDERIVGFELVETAPSLDPASAPNSPARNRTVAAAARTVAHFIAGVAGGRGK